MIEEMFHGMALCAGAAGLELGVALATSGRARGVVYVERGAEAAAVLVARMQEGRLHSAPIWSDLRTFDAAAWRGRVHFVTAGFPCQPISVAGKRGERVAREADERWLWPIVRERIEQCEPEIVVLENVDRLLRHGFEDVQRDLRSMGFVVQQSLRTAEEAGAPHLRKRLFVVGVHRERGGWERWSRAILGPPADADGIACRSSSRSDAIDPQHERAVSRSAGATRVPLPPSESIDLANPGCSVADTGHDGPRGLGAAYDRRGSLVPFGDDVARRRTDVGSGVERDPWAGGWPTGAQPGIRRLPHGMAGRMDRAADRVRKSRLHIGGNGVVPQQAALAIRDCFEALAPSFEPPRLLRPRARGVVLDRQLGLPF